MAMTCTGGCSCPDCPTTWATLPPREIVDLETQGAHLLRAAGGEGLRWSDLTIRMNVSNRPRYREAFREILAGMVEAGKVREGPGNGGRGRPGKCYVWLDGTEPYGYDPFLE